MCAYARNSEKQKYALSLSCISPTLYTLLLLCLSNKQCFASIDNYAVEYSYIANFSLITVFFIHTWN